jgi:hypothetical protein
MGKNILESISKLECFDIPKSVLHMRIYDKLEQAQDFSTQMESITKSTFLSFFGRQGLDRLKVEVVVQMKVV